MLNVWIIEDEAPAARRLAQMLLALDAGIKITGQYASVAETVEALKGNQPQLMLMDIHLADGSCFHIFNQAEVQCPVIFTTAYDEYAIDAFKINSIDYLLKPVKTEALAAALNKYYKHHAKPSAASLDDLVKKLTDPSKHYKQRFAIRYGDHLKVIDIADVAYFFTEHKANFLVSKSGQKYIVDYNLDTLEHSLNPHQFFRVNRQFIVSVAGISEMLSWSKARVLLKLHPPVKDETIVSAERSAVFKQWLDDSLP